MDCILKPPSLPLGIPCCRVQQGALLSIWGGVMCVQFCSSLVNSAFWNTHGMLCWLASCVLVLFQGQTPFDVADEGLVEHLEMLQKKQTVVRFWLIVFHLSNYVSVHRCSLKNMVSTQAWSWGPAIFVSHSESLIAPIFSVARNLENWVIVSRRSEACWQAEFCKLIRNCSSSLELDRCLSVVTFSSLTPNCSLLNEWLPESTLGLYLRKYAVTGKKDICYHICLSYNRETFDWVRRNYNLQGVPD